MAYEFAHFTFSSVQVMFNAEAKKLNLTLSRLLASSSYFDVASSHL